MEIIAEGKKPVIIKNLYECRCSCGFNATDEIAENEAKTPNDLLKECPTCQNRLKWFMNNDR